MRIVVCVKQTAAGDLNPFDACAYEAALQIPDGEVILLSMGPDKTEEMLLNLTRLGAKEGYLIAEPILVNGDLLGTVVVLSKTQLDENKLGYIRFATAILGAVVAQ